MLDTVPPRTERKRRRKKHDRLRGLVWFLIFLVILALVAAPLGWFWRSIGASGPRAPVAFTIPEGSTGNQIAESLEEKEIIRSAFGFRLLAKVRGVSLDGFEAGEYEMTTNMSAGEALDVLKQGPKVEPGIPVGPIREGLRLEEVAPIFTEDLAISKKAFIKAAKSGTFSLPPWLPEGTGTVEGFLFPSKYEFPKDEEITPVQAIQRLLDQFQRAVAGLPWEKAKQLGVSPYEVVTIASLIEKEAKWDEDRAKIAAVIYNRLDKGMALEIDATVQYALGGPRYWQPILIKDRQVESPYNTYLHRGLPPGPIASPGVKAIEAALAPTDANFLYYVVIDDAGHHAFTNSYDEFLKLDAQYP